MKILCIVGARPNFMKVAPVHAALQDAGHAAVLVHTGQHYDANMSKVFFDDLGMPRPDVNLGIGSASHAVQTAKVMQAIEPVLLEHRPDAVLVAGDVNSTLAAALVACKLGMRVAHLEAGLRSFDRSMPEEVNRVLTDQVSDLCLTPSPDADINLENEGIAAARIARVGNAMIDSLLAHLEHARQSDILARLGLATGHYGLVTLHRPSNVDASGTLAGLLGALAQVSRQLPVVFPVHPRTMGRIDSFGLRAMLTQAPNLVLLEPTGYLDFLALEAGAQLILTDSGGIQEESTVLGVPCLTLRPNTERPITVSEGTNTLVGSDPAVIVKQARAILRRRKTQQGEAPRPALWDGHTAPRVVAALEAHFSQQEA